jgi:hypothetical protein
MGSDEDDDDGDDEGEDSWRQQVRQNVFPETVNLHEGYTAVLFVLFL